MAVRRSRFKTRPSETRSETAEPPPFSPERFGVPNELHQEFLTKVLNTAIISTLDSKAPTRNMQELISSPAYTALLEGLRFLVEKQGLDEQTAAESLIQTFRDLDKVWQEYVMSQGIEKIRKSLGS